MKTNHNGNRLIRFCAEFQSPILNTYFRHKPAHSYTWYSNDNHTRKIYDLAITNKFLQRFCLDCRVRRSFDFHSDHKLVVTRFKTQKHKTLLKTSKYTNSKSKKFDFKNFTQSNKENFVNSLIENLLPTQHISPETLVETIQLSAEEFLPKVNKTQRQTFPWDNDNELKELLEQRKQYHIKHDKQQYRATQRKIRNRVTLLRNKHYAHEASKFTAAQTARDIAQSYKIAKEQSKIHKKKPRQVDCPGLLDHFRNHFNPDQLNTPDPPSLPLTRDQPLNINDLPPTIDEITKAINRLRNNKASLDIPAELLKLSLESNEFKTTIHDFYKDIWESRKVPDYFGKGEISTIFKNKGSPRDPTKYRGITLSSILTKVLVNIVLERCLSFYDDILNEGQMGFRPGRGCTDGIYCLKRIHQWARKQQKEIYIGMVDLSAAFDHIRRDWLFTIVQGYFGNLTMFEIIRDMYSKTECTMKGSSTVFKTTSGVRQGGPESPLLYNIYANKTLEIFQQRCWEAGIRFVDIPYKIPAEVTGTNHVIAGILLLLWLGYADDIVLAAWCIGDLQKMIEILNEVFSEYCLKLNADKTETLILNWKLGKPNEIDVYPQSIVNLNGIEIKNSKSFKYLGAFTQYNNSSTGDVELEHRITSAICKFYELKPFFTNYKIKLHTRVLYLESLVRSRLMYGCQYWTLTKTQFKHVESQYVKFLRYLVKGGNQRRPELIEYTTRTGKKGTFKKLLYSNEQVKSLINRPSLSHYLQNQQFNWIAHCTRASNDRYIKKLTFEHYHPELKKKPGVTN